MFLKKKWKTWKKDIDDIKNIQRFFLFWNFKNSETLRKKDWNLIFMGIVKPIPKNNIFCVVWNLKITSKNTVLRILINTHKIQNIWGVLSSLSESWNKRK